MSLTTSPHVTCSGTWTGAIPLCRGGTDLSALSGMGSSGGFNSEGCWRESAFEMGQKPTAGPDERQIAASDRVQKAGTSGRHEGGGPATQNNVVRSINQGLSSAAYNLDGHPWLMFAAPVFWFNQSRHDLQLWSIVDCCVLIPTL
ncbi:hypothetical protein [Sagittula sp. P11]|uniref:hypothetical protein n=1 Tax=Sagittula sp. P11 TaxID=2009329 RepID=UPI0012FE48AC|nr:hypothetical protein [Sagittula sp. P11]